MQLLSNRSLKQKFVVLSSALIAIVVAISTLLIVNFQGMIMLADNLQHRDTVLLVKAGQLKLSVVQVQQWLTDISATRGLDGLADGFDEAEKSVADSAELLELVRIARQPINFAIMEQAKKHYTGERAVFHKVNGAWEARPEFRAMIGPFTDLCIRQGVTRVKEWCTSPEEYRASTYRILSLGMKEHLAYGKKVLFVSPDSTELRPGSATMLTDGKRGGHEYDYNWFGCSGQNLEVIIDLGTLKTVKHIESAYYHFAYWRTIAPTKVEYFISTDGTNFTRVGENTLLLPIDQYGGFQRDVIAEFAPQEARYVKVFAYSIGNTPDWHPGAGQPAIMSVDEIVVE